MLPQVASAKVYGNADAAQRAHEHGGHRADHRRSRLARLHLLRGEVRRDFASLRARTGSTQPSAKLVGGTEMLSVRFKTS
jgi:hypothetical protein